jgi:fructan beta-fructosidase
LKTGHGLRKIMLLRLFFPLILSGNIFLYSQGNQTMKDEKYNPEYHYYPSFDPTGLFFYGGSYFINWGSAYSKDLIHWKICEFGKERNKLFKTSAIENLTNPVHDKQQVISGMSGSVVVDKNNTSGLGKNGNPPLVALQMDWQNQTLSYSNDSAKTWIKYNKQTVIQNSTGIFRDPKVFWYEPDKKWIMILGMSEIQEVKFYSSNNLIDWVYMSKFGPWGAVEGQWECVDFFPLPVDGLKSNIKWVLEISLQPRSGQYFVGDFDGRKFKLDEDFIDFLSYNKYHPSGDILFDFERGLDEWKFEGDAFDNCPTNEEETNGKVGNRCIKSSGKGKGKITSPEFTIRRNFIHLLAGGGYYPERECINLIIDGKIVRSLTGNGGNAHLNWKGWDVTEFRGKNATIEIVDNISGDGINSKSYISCDEIMLCDDLPKTPYREYNPGWEKAFWIDYGPDFYAVRSWNNYAPEENRTIWAGWMGIWTYAFSEPIPGILSVPRNIGLRKFPEGIRLIQNPIKETESLRISHKVADTITFEGVWKPKKITPARNTYELIVEFENISSKEFGLKLCVGENEKTIVGYQATNDELFLDRRQSGYDEFSEIFPCISHGPLKNRTNNIKLHVFIDKCSIEVFGNDGETVMSAKIYPDLKSLGIELFSNLGKVKVKSLELWELGSINLY